MASEWELRPLKECAVWYSGGTPSKANSGFWGGTIPWISAKSLSDFFIQDSDDRVTEKAVGNGTRLVPKDTILFIVRGMSLKNEFRMGITKRPVTFNQDLKALVPVADVWPDFLAYAIRAKTAEILGLVGEAGHGTGVLPTDRIQSLPIPLPHLAEQKTIAGVFRALDDKIELNRRMNKTLESIAQTLFKSWFIDFDPVIDNALAAGSYIPEELQPRAAIRESLGEARNPLPEELLKLFPSEFVLNEEMGWIPKDWEVAPFSQIATLETKSVHPNSAPDKLWVHFSIPAFDDCKLPKHETGESIKSGKYVVPPSSVLASKLNPQFPRVWLPEIEDDLTSICSTEFMPFVPVDPTERSFLYAFLCSEIAQSEIVKRATGSTGSRQRVKPKEIAEMPIVTPPRETRDSFSLISNSLYSRMLANMKDIATTTKLRDVLLPKLLSGEIRIPEAEKVIETVV